MCKEALHQAGMSVKLTMTCDDCAESLDGEPAQACCPQCLEEQRNTLDDTDYLEEHIIEVEPPGPRRALVMEDKLTAVMEELAEEKAMCAKLAEALKVAQAAMEERSSPSVVNYMTHNQREIWDSCRAAVEAALKEWEDGK
jgi:hypothetical protein